ncbi:hypothetical protein JOD43_001566 [Pullulanibacillus pueri]|nr:hypothetical protein [Pullulanibacillus pueri]
MKTNQKAELLKGDREALPFQVRDPVTVFNALNAHRI